MSPILLNLKIVVKKVKILANFSSFFIDLSVIFELSGFIINLSIDSKSFAKRSKIKSKEENKFLNNSGFLITKLLCSFLIIFNIIEIVDKTVKNNSLSKIIV